MLLGRTLFCVAANLTTSELLTRDRYAYLNRDDGTFWNRFDRGPVANCAQFWVANGPDWSEEYAAEQQVGFVHPDLPKCLSDGLRPLSLFILCP